MVSAGLVVFCVHSARCTGIRLFRMGIIKFRSGVSTMSELSQDCEPIKESTLCFITAVSVEAKIVLSPPPLFQRSSALFDGWSVL